MVFLRRGLFLFLFFSFPSKGEVLNCTPQKLCLFLRPEVIDAIQKEEYLPHYIKIQKKSKNFEIVFQSDLFNLEIIGRSLKKKDLLKVFQFPENQKIENEGILSNISLLENYLNSVGQSGYEIFIDELLVGKRKILTFFLILKKQKPISSIEFSLNLRKLDLQHFEEDFHSLKGKSFQVLHLQKIIKNLEESLRERGHLYARVKYERKERSLFFNLFIHIIPGPKVHLGIRGTHYKNSVEIIKELKSIPKNKPLKLSPSLIKTGIKKSYVLMGLYGTTVDVQTVKRKSDTYFFITIKEGKKIPVKTVTFSGNSFLSDQTLLKLFQKTSSSLLANMYFDEKGLDSFSDELKNEYRKRGFPMVNVHSSHPPTTGFLEWIEIKIDISEGIQYFIEDIVPCVCPEALKNKVLSTIQNKRKTPVNFIEIENDLSKAIELLKENGYLYAKLKYKNKREFLRPGNASESLIFHLNIDPGPQVVLRNVLVEGVKKTKEYIVRREVIIEREQILSPSKISEVKERIQNLNLFKKVQIIRKKSQGTSKKEWNDLLLKVEEKNFGEGEMALGYRTDLGIRGATTISYNNLWGRNFILTNKVKGNYRLSGQTLGEERKDQFNKGEDRLVEYNVASRFTFPYLWSVPLRTTLGASYIAKRFFAFDAKILRLSYGNSFKILKNLSFNANYRFEQIRQFNALDIRENDSFQIGSISPTLTLDLREGPLTFPTGALFGLSFDFANPTFFSQKKQGFTINYGRFVGRANFYVPLEKKTLWANSFSWGIAHNFAGDKGHIPSIKGFRMSGQDYVRGFSEEEINRLKDGKDVGEIKLTSDSYFSLIKSEVRHLFSENLVVGSFLDAGRIFVNSYSPLSLRSSIGITLKYITPVGSIDFDYGVKLFRRSYPGQKEESFGRFHLSIGPF